MFVHHSKNGFEITMDPVPFKPDVCSSVIVDTPACSPARADPLGQRQILCRHVHPLYKSIVAAMGDAEKTTHPADAVLSAMTIDSPIPGVGLPFLPVSERRSASTRFPPSSDYFQIRQAAAGACNTRPCFCPSTHSLSWTVLWEARNVICPFSFPLVIPTDPILYLSLREPQRVCSFLLLSFL